MRAKSPRRGVGSVIQYTYERPPRMYERIIDSTRRAYSATQPAPQHGTLEPPRVFIGKPSFAPMKIAVTSGCTERACSRAFFTQSSMNGFDRPVLMRASL